MSKEWPLAWRRGAVRLLSGDRLEARVGRRSHVVDLAGATLSFARWSFGAGVYGGAVLVVRDGERTVTIASSHTPRDVTYEGEVKKPTAILRPEGFEALLEALGDRLDRAPPSGEAARTYSLRPAMRRDLVLGIAATPVLTLLMMSITAFDTGRADVIAGTLAAFAIVTALAFFFVRRAARAELVVGDTHVELTVNGRTRRADRANLAGEAGHVVVTARFGSWRYPALAFRAEGLRVVIASMEGTQSWRGPVLRWGRRYLLPADEYDRLAKQLRLR